MNLSDRRREYQNKGLDPAEVASDPIEQFSAWFDEVASAGLREPNAVVLATADAVGRPSARHVLVKDVDRLGFVFYTNYESDKARSIAVNAWASMVFVWSDLARQVIVCGPAERIKSELSDAYFARRPRESQLGAWASDQSRPLDSRATLEERYRVLSERFTDDLVPRPPHWGGIRLRPHTVEFWQGRPNRLHDRVRYTAAESLTVHDSTAETGRSREGWKIERLNP